MDLIYIYVGKVGRPIENFGINFNRNFKVAFDYTTGKLRISKVNDKLSENSIYGKRITDVDLIVGKNGSGKTTVLSLLGLSRTERLTEYPTKLNTRLQDEEYNKRTWFALYHIENDIFAIEGYWHELLGFMRDSEFDHFQTCYSLCFKYD